MLTEKDNGIKMNTSELIHTFDDLVETTQALCLSIRSNHQGYWLPLTEDEQSNGITPLNKACNMLSDFWYKDGLNFLL